MFKKVILFIFLLTLFTNNVKASHLMGGEITWDCSGGGKYVFTMKLYRDCNGPVPAAAFSISVFNHPTVTSIPVSLVSQSDISPICNVSGPAISCAAAEAEPGWPSSPSTIAGAVKEYVYQSVPTTLLGIPPLAGWIFTFDECCRNPSISNLQTPSGYGIELRAIMHAYNGMNAGPCFDSSPKFSESPSTIICVGYPFTYNQNAYDPELDSLSYSWAQPFDRWQTGTYNPPANPIPVPFAATYSYTSPLPGPLQNASNVPATINPKTGEISFTSFTQGNFVTVVKVEAWKCGQLVAEIFREMQIVLLPCATNNPPAVTYTSYQDTVIAGTNVNFTITGNDVGLLADGITPQSVTISATGNQFGTGFTSTTTGCSNPPCATLSPVSPATGITTSSSTFNWQTSCNHISKNTTCNTHSNTYTFVFKTKDDFCPAPAENISTVSITVLALPIVSSPLPKCVSVLPSGDVTLTWIAPVDTGGTFNAYMIYSANAFGGPYTLIDSVFSLSTTTYTHIGANANAAPVYYYIKTRSGCNVLAAAMDTISSIHLTAINPANGTAILNWNPIASPAISTSTGVYKVYVEFPTGVWTLVGSTTGLSFIDTIFVCNRAINFRVEIADNTGCTSVSSVDGGVFQNIIVPATPSIDTLSVDNANTALMNWNASPSLDVAAYIIYLFNGTSWIPIDTVYGINNTNYNYLLSNAGASSEQYRIAAFDTCGNVSPLGSATGTMYLSAVPDICNRSADLTWTAYPLLGTGLSGYRVFQSTTGLIGPFTLIGTVSSSTLTFTASGLAASTNYFYKVEAFDVSGLKTVSSNRISFFSAIPIPPTFSYLRKVSVVDPNQVNVSCHVDIAASTLKYKIMRSEDNLTFAQVGIVADAGITPVLYTDNSVLTDKKSYYYKIINVDSCGYDGIETNIGRTILLTANGYGDNVGAYNKMTWNDYESWSGNVMSYNIYRGIDGVFDPTPIANVPFSGVGPNTYIDDLTSYLQGSGIFNYYVEAIEGMGNAYGFSENSISNIAEAYQEPLIYIPNSFKPSGSNTVFIPVTTYVDIKDYQFDIFNRWGLKQFSTTDINEGWDGTHGNTKCEFGVYVYLLRFRTSRGEYIELKGSVTLLR